MPWAESILGIFIPLGRRYSINLNNKVNSYIEYSETELINLALKIDDKNCLLNTVKTELISGLFQLLIQIIVLRKSAIRENQNYTE